MQTNETPTTIVKHITNQITKVRSIGKTPMKIQVDCIHAAILYQALEYGSAFMISSPIKNSFWGVPVEEVPMLDIPKVICKEDVDNLAYMKWYHKFGRNLDEHNT